MAPSTRKVMMAGVGEDGQPLFAELADDRLTFGVALRDGKLALVEVPRLLLGEGRRWVRDRLARFAKYEDCRESAEEAIRRKALAAQGRIFLQRLKAGQDAEFLAELRTMFSPDSHDQGVPLTTVRAAPPVAITVSATGEVFGLPDSKLRDTEGRLLA